ncbi:MAG: tetratricopeptide repeat protein [Nitrospirae bacterium YQR-1]
MEDTHKGEIFKNTVIIAAIIGLTFFAYYDVTGFSFINYDDHMNITQNPYVQDGLTLKSIKWAFVTTYSYNWIPLSWLSHMSATELFGMNAGRHHLVNVIIHTLNALLIFFTFRAISIPVFPCAFAALAFAVHPMHTESVAWVSERKDVLYTFFYFISIYAYSYYVKKQGSLRYTMVFLTFALSLMSKPMAVTLPLILLILDFWPLGRIRYDEKQGFPTRTVLSCVMEKIPFFMLSALMSLITYSAQDTQGAVSSELSLVIRLENAFLSYVKYIYMMFVPMNLSVFYPYPTSISVLQFIPSFLIIVIISFLAVKFSQRIPYLFTGWFWFIVMLLPVIGFIQAGAQAIADRYTYVSFLGLFLVIAMPLNSYFEKKKIGKLVLIIAVSGILIYYTCLTKKQAGYWSDSMSLFQHSASVRPDNYIAHYNLGSELNNRGQFEAAYGNFKETVRVVPNYVLAYVGMGIALNGLQQTEAAAEAFMDALFINPSLPEAYNGLGITLSKMEDFNKKPQIAEFLKTTFENDFTDNYKAALACFNKAVTLKPDYGDAYVNLGNILFFIGRYEKAIESFNAAIQTRPYFPEAYNGIGVVLMKNGKYQEAAAYFTKALSQNASDQKAKKNLEIARALYLKAKQL